LGLRITYRAKVKSLTLVMTIFKVDRH